MKKILVMAMMFVVTGTTLAEAQFRPRPSAPRPPWQDVCCGGPCCPKPIRPGR
ncbi:hypothetical protein [Prosthecomicrobium sp. N25]|uniref:hypothetical protein n=1 Tax=Prosthecomicrobium sp. N25 TaxID=3129254 RepID=UPI003078A324